MNGKEKDQYISIEKPNILLVEGKDDLKFFEALIDELSITKKIQLEKLDGKQDLRDVLKGISVDPKIHLLKKIGVVIDSNDDPKAAYDTVISALQNAGFKIPKKESKLSTEIIPQTCFFLMPGSGQLGSLEDLCLHSIENYPEMECVNNFITCVQNLKEENKLLRNISKSRLNSFLAVQKKGNLRLGQAVRAKIFPLSSNEFQNIISFIKLLE